MAEPLKIASSEGALKFFSTDREIVDLAGKTDFTDIAAAVVTDSDEDIASVKLINATKFDIPVFMLTADSAALDASVREMVFHFLDNNDESYRNIYDSEIETAAATYEDKMIPPFFKEMVHYVEEGNLNFDTPGHHGGQFFLRHPAGRALYNFYGENLFRSDVSSSDVEVGDLLTHGGAALDGEKHAARVFNADKTYFVMNGTTTSNAIVDIAAVKPGDLVLFDRNNHKSNYNAALVQAGGLPVYLETERNPFGFIGGIDDAAFNEDYIRAQAAKVDPEKAKEKRPFRLAIIELGTYDGSIYNARQVIKRIGRLCDYILFDSAWVGYEQFIPMMKDSSPLLIDDLGPEDPGIFVTQSVHKQMGGLSQASQIHKKDKHIKGQKRYIDHKRFNNAYMKYTSTSPFYPIYSTLDVNAKMMEGPAGAKMWIDTVKLGIEARKRMLKESTMFTPFIPTTVHGKKWEDVDTDTIANDIDYWRFSKGEKWHSFAGYADNQYFVDPLKFMLKTPGINMETGEYEDFGVPATLISSYLREHGIIPEKSDLNSILFLLTPAETKAKLDNLVNFILQLEKLIKEDAPLSDVLPKIYAENIDRYRGYTIRQLCQEIHDFYKKSNAKAYQRALFREKTWPKPSMTPYDADKALVANNAKLVPLDKIVGETALEGALPYPPGILCVAPGEVWNKEAATYFTILQEGINNFPGFDPEIQGVYMEPQEDGRVKAYGYVYDKDAKK